MSTPTCPVCGRPTAKPLDLSDGAYVNYYRCEPCATVWTTPKGEPDKVTLVTSAPRSPSRPVFPDVPGSPNSTTTLQD